MLLENNNVNHPSHYADGWSNGAEVIDITEHLCFNLGNAVKYCARAGKKNPDKRREDIEKALWYLQRELEYGDRAGVREISEREDKLLSASDTSRNREAHYGGLDPNIFGSEVRTGTEGLRIPEKHLRDCEGKKVNNLDLLKKILDEMTPAAEYDADDLIETLMDVGFVSESSELEVGTSGGLDILPVGSVVSSPTGYTAKKVNPNTWRDSFGRRLTSHELYTKAFEFSVRLP